MLRNACEGMCTAVERLFASAVTFVKTSAIFLLVIALTYGGTANAAEIKVFTARAIATVLDKIGPEFERTTGHKLNVISGFSPIFVKQINAGEPFDIIVSPPPTIDGLIKDGKVTANTRTNLVRSGIGVEVRAGAPKPDISSVEAFKRALLNAKSITYLPIGGVPQLVDRLGIAEAIKSKTTIPASDIVSELVAKGEIELGVVVITQILTTPGVELVGPLPPEIQFYTTFTAGVSSNSQAPEVARELIKFLTGPTAIPVIQAQGMELANEAGMPNPSDNRTSNYETLGVAGDKRRPVHTATRHS
jgi:molybdate transport system substrate-binding protein